MPKACAALKRLLTLSQSVRQDVLLVPAFVGIAFGMPAFLINRRVAGWQDRVSRLGPGECVVLTIVAIVVYHVPLK